MRLKLANNLLARDSREQWCFEEFAFSQGEAWYEAPHRDNVQAFEEKFDVFLMTPALPARVRLASLPLTGSASFAGIALPSRHGRPARLLFRAGSRMPASLRSLLELPEEQVGAKLLLQACSQTDSRAGDGTTTSAVLTQALCILTGRQPAIGDAALLHYRGDLLEMPELLACQARHLLQ